ncbi:MAG: AmmeMemoRadiSam system protein A [Phycisphaerae bacterium]|jgi:AmmeMemoRadiSam system protein A|nr:AmmeMemoRadiSam system protein A [Phycisphaerae bacterium]MDP7286786.1 AmmeMemoRadiSam system protein A [Phycisphaerae bacterium]
MTISAEDRSTLVTLARQAVAAQVTGQPRPEAPPDQGLLAEERGCFVTLTNAGYLRGCIGTFQPDRPLGEMIIEMGMSAAGHDPRFLANPITADELDHLHIEVSVLSPLEKTDDPLGLEIGTHGIYVQGGGRSGCFLPEVATDQGWDAQQFLDHCCASKAGMGSGAWRQSDTTVYLFTSEKFSG